VLLRSGGADRASVAAASGLGSHGKLGGMEFDFSLSNPHIVSEDLGAPAPICPVCLVSAHQTAGPMHLGQTVPGRKFSLVCVLPSLVGGGCERYHCASQQQHESSTYVPPAQRNSVSWLLAGCLYLAQHVVQTDALTGQRFVNCMQLSKQGDVPFPELPVGERDGFRRVPDGGA